MIARTYDIPRSMVVSCREFLSASGGTPRTLLSYRLVVYCSLIQEAGGWNAKPAQSLFHQHPHHPPDPHIVTDIPFLRLILLKTSGSMIFPHNLPTGPESLRILTPTDIQITDLVYHDARSQATSCPATPRAIPTPIPTPYIRAQYVGAAPSAALKVPPPLPAVPYIGQFVNCRL